MGVFAKYVDGLQQSRQFSAVKFRCYLMILLGLELMEVRGLLLT